ncbi:hypothetical protein DF185_03645 [Marinifilum breve]|uniref:Uncharacterized protein n=1 Tax=Marinifilum breve TaxID=2184082 RepID=A0A2V4A3U9_9BACT|nr:hypothetical protein DF185_03645 [Marinifilum breve]
MIFEAILKDIEKFAVHVNYLKPHKTISRKFDYRIHPNKTIETIFFKFHTIDPKIIYESDSDFRNHHLKAIGFYS